MPLADAVAVDAATIDATEVTQLAAAGERVPLGESAVRLQDLDDAAHAFGADEAEHVATMSGRERHGCGTEKPPAALVRRRAVDVGRLERPCGIDEERHEPVVALRDVPVAFFGK